MFTVLNRFRGTEAFWAKINGVILSTLLYFLVDVYTAVFVGLLYVAGESMGWGKWIGGIMSGNRLSPTPRQLADIEGEKNGIHWLANLLSPEIKNYYRYCVVALSIRGFYWFSLTFLPLAVMGYLDIYMYLISSIMLGVSFPVSVELGKWSKDKFTIDWGYLKIHGTWEHAEVWYGLFQNIIFVSIVIYALL